MISKDAIFFLMPTTMPLSTERELPEELLDHIVSFSTRNTLMKLC